MTSEREATKRLRNYQEMSEDDLEQEEDEEEEEDNSGVSDHDLLSLLTSDDDDDHDEDGNPKAGLRIRTFFLILIIKIKENT